MDLPRHFRQVHKISASQSKEARLNFNLRKKWIRKEIKVTECTDKDEKKSRVFVRKLCQFPGCYATPKRMHNHLRVKHKLKLDSVEYRKYLKEAMPVLQENDVKESQTILELSDDEEVAFQRISPQSDKQKEIKMDLIDDGINDSDDDEDFLLDESDSSCNESDSSSDDGSSTGNPQQINNNNTECILDEFLEWLQGVDGGERKVKAALQNVRQVRRILTLVDPEGMDMSSLGKRAVVRDAWLAPYKASERRPGTIRSYCNSLRLCMEFIEVTKLVKLPLGDIRSMQTQARVWSKSLNKKTKCREFRKIYEDLDNIFDPEKVTKFESSKPCREAIAIIQEFSVAKVGVCPKQSQYTLTRDFLLWSLSMENGGRPGPFMDMTLDQFANAKLTKSSNIDGGECFVLPIFDHKTDYAHGPAQVVFSIALYNWFKIFIDNIRGRFYGIPKTGSTPVFVAHNGNPMQSSNASGRLTSLWGKGFQKGAKMNNTLIRKSVTTEIHKNHKDLIVPIANKLLHHVETAKRYYNVVRKGDDAVETSQKMAQIFKIPHREMSSSQACNSESPSKGIKWDDASIAELQQHFSDALQSGDVNMADVRLKISEVPELQKHERDIKKVLDKLRYMAKTSSQGQSLNLKELPLDSLEERINRGCITKVTNIFTFILVSLIL